MTLHGSVCLGTSPIPASSEPQLLTPPRQPGVLSLNAAGALLDPAPDSLRSASLCCACSIPAAPPACRLSSSVAQGPTCTPTAPTSPSQDLGQTLPTPALRAGLCSNRVSCSRGPQPSAYSPGYTSALHQGGAHDDRVSIFLQQRHCKA